MSDALEKVFALLKEGLNAEDVDGNTPLILASGNGYAEIVKALLKKNADVSIQNKDGQTALFWARANCHPEIAKLLREYTAVTEKKVLDFVETIPQVDGGLANSRARQRQLKSYCL